MRGFCLPFSAAAGRVPTVVFSDFMFCGTAAAHCAAAVFLTGYNIIRVGWGQGTSIILYIVMSLVPPKTSTADRESGSRLFVPKPERIRNKY